MSLIEATHQLARQIKAESNNHCPGSAAREFAIAITSLEDVATRIARGLALKAGTIPTPESVAEATLEAAEEAVHPDQLSFLSDEADLAESA